MTAAGGVFQQILAELLAGISFYCMSPSCVVVSQRLRLFKSCETWRGDGDIRVSQLKIGELLTCNSRLLCSRTRSTLLLSCSLLLHLLLLRPLTSPPNDVIRPLGSLHAMCPYLSLVSQGIMGWRTLREEGRLVAPLLAALSPFTLTLVCPRQSLQPSSLYLPSSIFPFPFGPSLPLPPSVSNLNKQCSTPSFHYRVGWDPMQRDMLMEYWWQRGLNTSHTHRRLADGQ